MSKTSKKRAPLTFGTAGQGAISAPLGLNSKEPAVPQLTETVSEPKTQKPKARDGKQFIAAHVIPEASKQFKLLALQQDKTSQDLLIEAINDVFAKYGMSRIAE